MNFFESWTYNYFFKLWVISCTKSSKLSESLKFFRHLIYPLGGYFVFNFYFLQKKKYILNYPRMILSFLSVFSKSKVSSKGYTVFIPDYSLLCQLFTLGYWVFRILYTTTLQFTFGFFVFIPIKIASDTDINQ